MKAVNTASAAVPSAPVSTTAEDTLRPKSKDAALISGGHLVARALKTISRSS